MPNAWTNEWNSVIRYIIFQDAELKSLMNIPENTHIIDFKNKYFIRTGTVSTPLKDESVRISYGVFGTSLAGSPRVLRQEMSFDIYVKQQDLNNVGSDRLVNRTEVIAQRLQRLLTDKNNPLLEGFDFRCIGESDMATNTIGYVRYNVTFMFTRTV